MTLLQRFAFVPQARLDDLMISWASDGGGVGPHFDSYDVFLLQARAAPLAHRPAEGPHLQRACR
jgi:ribosomal protein L16 Arg81 hydroxylase